MQAGWGQAVATAGVLLLALLSTSAALDRGRATPEVLNGGDAWVQLGRSQEAVRMFERSLAVMSNQPAIRQLPAEIRKKPGEVPRE